MARALADDMQQLGGLARRRQLERLGHSVRSIRAAIDSRALRVVARSWVATPAAPPDAVRAVALRGALGGASALASYGVWVPHEVPLCVATSHSASRLPPLRGTEWRLRIPGAGAAKTNDPRSPQWRVSLGDALLQHARCCPSDDQIVASFDSALHSGAVSRQRLLAISEGMPRRIRRLLRHVDARAESGLESLLRLACEREGWSVELQVRIDGVGRVDLVINGWLVIEADGSAWHDDPRAAHRDRLRNSALVLGGYRWHRFGYEPVMFDLDGCVTVVRALLASGRPLLRA
jgi:very-short-patch-repair endonuclease